MIPAGKRKNRVAIYTRTQGAQNALGEPAMTWALTETLWGSREPLQGDEFMTGDAEAWRQHHRVRILYRSLNPADNRLVIDGTTYEIKAVSHDDRKIVTTMVVTEASDGI